MISRLDRAYPPRRWQSEAFQYLSIRLSRSIGGTRGQVFNPEVASRNETAPGRCMVIAIQDFKVWLFSLISCDFFH